MLTFVVYYRIHLNLNLEASARQRPHHYRAHSFVGKSTLKPLVRRVALDLSQSCQYNNSLTGDLTLAGVCRWAFLPDRALVVLKVSRRTLWPYLWEILDTVTWPQVTRAVVFQDVVQSPLSKATQSRCVIRWISFSVQTIPSHAHQNSCNIYVCTDWYIFAISCIWQYYTGDLSCKPYVTHDTAFPSCLASPWRVLSWEQTSWGPFLTLAPVFYVHQLFMARDRQTWLTSESIFQVIIWLAQALL